MPETLSPYFIELVSEAALRSYWRRRSLATFLRRSGIKPEFLGTWDKDESKRDLLARLFPILERTEAGVRTIRKIANFLADQTSFPDLLGWDDSAEKITAAKDAVAELKEYLRKAASDEAAERAIVEARKRAQVAREEATRRTNSLEKLTERLNALGTKLGTQQAGYDFERWFYDLTDFFELVCRRPYVNKGRQIDGSVTVDGTTYLVELKFTSGQTDGPAIDSFFKRVHGVADNTMGVMVSISGYTKVAIQEASGPRTPLLLLDHGHLYLVLTGMMTLQELINRLRRHSSQTGQAYLSPADV